MLPLFYYFSHLSFNHFKEIVNQKKFLIDNLFQLEHISEKENRLFV